MGIFAVIVMGVFLYTGGRYLLPNLITGTSTGEGIILNVVPIVIAACVVAATIKVLK